MPVPDRPVLKAFPLRTTLFVWLALLLLLAVTAGTSFLALGPFNLVVNAAIASAKAGLVLVFFMHFPSASRMVKIAGAAGIVWLSLLFALSLTDFLSRGP